MGACLRVVSPKFGEDLEIFFFLEIEFPLKFMELYLVKHSFEASYYTISSHCSCRPANIGFTRNLGCHSVAHGQPNLLRYDSNSLSVKLTDFYCYTSNATENSVYFY